MSTKQYGWVKYRLGDAASAGEWRYKEVELPFTKKHRENLREQLEDENTWHEHSRGIDIVLIPNPPKQYLIRQIESSKKSIAYAVQRIERLSNLAATLPDKKLTFWTHSGLISPSKPDGSGWKRIYADDIIEARKIVDSQRIKA